MVKNAIKVYARLKPEKSRKKVTNHEVYHRPKEHVKEDFLVLTAPPRISNEYIDNRPESWNFSFFQIFEESTEQEILFDEVAKPVIDSVLDGYNGTIFAYGQTGSGKTYTITGDQKTYRLRGILPRSLQYLFDIVKKHPENLYSVEVSYLEIYNESGYDLLNRKQEWNLATKIEDLPRVTIQEDETGTLHLKNLSFWSVSNEKDALDLLFIGDTNRVVSATPMNPLSSRSHCVFTIIVSVKKFGADRYSRAKMHLVDLAGSERVYKCAITGTILTEAKHINLSLHYLEQVIVCLGHENANHIPYRNSLLTAILRDSLGGNCLTTMLATLSLSTENLEETISTCRFAQRVALVKNDVNLILEKDVNSENALLKMENERLKQQIEILTKQHIIQSARELSTEEKMSLDSSVERFIESGENLICDKEPRKLEYCFESLKRTYKLKKLRNNKEAYSSENLGYYKNLVLQRDKEISLLIDMLKKEKEKNSKQSYINDAAQEKKNKKINDFSQKSMSKVSDFSGQRESKDVTEVPVTSVQYKNDKHIKLLPEDKKLSSKNQAMFLTQQDITQLRNLINTYEGRMLNYNQPPKVERNLEKTENLSDAKPVSEHKFNSKDRTEIKYSTQDINKNKSENVQNKEDKVQSTQFTSPKEDVHRDMFTLNLFEIVKDDLRDNTISETKSGKSKIQKTKQSSSRAKHKSKTSSESNLFSDSTDQSLISKETSNFPEKELERRKKNVSHNSSAESNHSSTNNQFLIMFDDQNGIYDKDINKPLQEMPSSRETSSGQRLNELDQSAGNCDIFMSASKDFTTPGNSTVSSRKHSNMTDRSLGSSVNLHNARSISSLKSEASICVNNTDSIRSSNTSSKSKSTEFLNSSQRERNSSPDLMRRFQADLNSTMTLNSFNSLKQRENKFAIPVDVEGARFIEKSAIELEKRLLSKDEDNFEEELSRMEKYLPSSSRISARPQVFQKSKEDEDFEKSLPLTGDPDIDEEIIAFYKAKREGGAY